jgi:hypothetical protein
MPNFGSLCKTKNQLLWDFLSGFACQSVFYNIKLFKMENKYKINAGRARFGAQKVR